MKYTAHIHNTGSLIKETKIILKTYSRLKSWKKTRKEIKEENLLLKESEKHIEKCIFIVKNRYINSEKDYEETPFISLINSSIKEQTKQQIMYYYFSLSDQLIFDITTQVLYQKFIKGYSSVQKQDIEDFLKKQEETHPEIKNWSITTRNKLIRQYLAAMKDFKILEGSKIKELNKPFITLQTFLYVLHSESEKGQTSRELLKSKVWKIFLLDEDDIKILLQEAAKEGYLTYEEKGTTINIILKHKNLEELTNGILTR